MQRQPLRCARLRSAGYDTKARELEIEFSNRDVSVYKGVPEDVFRKLLSAPNPASFFEDRIEEEYAVNAGQRDLDENAKSKLDDLFSGPKS